MGKVVRWSDLPEELVQLIADCLSSNIDLLHIRGICKPWRSAVANKKRFPNHYKHILPRLNSKRVSVSPTAFFRVTRPSSCPHKGWLIKMEDVSQSESVSGKVQLFCPFSRPRITPSNQTLDLLQFGISEIYQSNKMEYFECLDRISRCSARVVFVDNLLFTVFGGKIWCCKNGEESCSLWTKIENEQVENFSDITLHKGKIYALDLKGAIWWIILPQLDIIQFTLSIPLDDNEIDTRLVEYCGDLCIVHRFEKTIHVNRHHVKWITSFKIYKMDNELVRCVEVNSLGDKAIILATDSCFTVLAYDYYGCLENAIYFSDNGMKDVKVFKIDDGSIIDSSNQSCFEMFSPPFL